MNSIIVLGADRVGKSTAIRNSKDLMVRCGYKTEVIHFTGILPIHHSPSQQFIGRLNWLEPDLIDHLLIDRFVSDTVFYEPYRYKMPRINDSVCEEVESVLFGMSDKVSIILVCHDWDERLEGRHREEVLAEHPNSSLFWVNSQIEKRRLEHVAYYEHTERYIESITSIQNVHYLNANVLSKSVLSLEMSGGFDYSSLKAK